MKKKYGSLSSAIKVSSVDEDGELLQELIDKEKPMKIVPFTNFWGYKGFKCPKCGKALNGGDYCSDCGQRLDWSDEGKKEERK